MPQIRSKNLKNLDELVRTEDIFLEIIFLLRENCNRKFYLQVIELISQCQCQKQFFAKKISDGKYQVGESRNVIFIRVKYVIVIFVEKKSM